MQGLTKRFVESVFVLCCLFLVESLQGQIEEIKIKHRNAEVTGLQKSYRFTAAELPDTVSVKIIDPRGQLQVLPVQEAKVSARSSLDFAFNTKHWIPGMYHVVVNGKHGTYSKRFIIRDPRHQ